MKKNKKTIAVLTAMTTLLTTGCTLKVDEKKLLDKLGEFGIKISMDGDNVEVTVTETTKPETTTYTTQLTETQTTVTEPTILTNNSTKTTTEATTNIITNITSNNITTATTNTTSTKETTTTTNNVSLYNNEPIFVEKEEEYINPEKVYEISNQYIVKGTISTTSCKGETLYSIVLKFNNGRYDESLAQEIMELNGLSETVIEEGTSLTVPYTLVYCKGRSAELIANYARVSLDEVKKLNNVKDSQEIYPEEKYLIVKALEKDKTSYKTLNEEKQNIICGTVIKGDKVIECGKTFSEGSVTSLLSLTKNANEENKVEYIEIKNDGSMYVCSLAENVKDITVSNNIPVIICNNELDMYLKSISGEAEENYRTKINTQNITEEYYLYKMDDGTNIVSLDKIVEYGEPDKTIGGKQKTIG